MRTHKESLSKAHNLSLEQIEWAYALSVTLQGFGSLSFNRQYTILQTLCGIHETYQYDFATLSELWDVESTLSSEATDWLLKGLSQPRAGETFFSCLEQFQTEDMEQAQLEALRELEQQESANTEEDDISGESDDNDISEDIEWFPKDATTGHLLIRIQNPLCDAYHYYTFDRTINRSFPDLSYEQDLLTQWKSQHPDQDIPLAMLCINWNTSIFSGTKDTITDRYIKAHLAVQIIPHPFQHQVWHEGILQCSGEHQSSLRLAGINLQTQTLESDSQHLDHWTTELLIVRGENTPMWWKLHHQVTQSLNGEGFRGGFVSLRSNVHVQIVDEHNQRILGTPSDSPPLETSQFTEQIHGSRRSSRINNWLSDPPIDFSKHVVMNTAKTEPIFNNTPSLKQEHELTSTHTGAGNKLQGIFFAEMHSKTWQENSRQRVALSCHNSIVSTISGSLFWNQNHLDILEDGTLQWTWQDQSLHIDWLLNQKAQITTQRKLAQPDDSSQTIRIEHTQFTHHYSGPNVQ